METYRDYWAATIIRGFLAIAAGIVIVFTSAMASTIILLPAAFVISILCLAAYTTIDSALVITTSFMIPLTRPGRIPLRLQGIFGAGIGVFLFSLVYDRHDLHWFLYLLAMQAAGAAITEFLVARGTAAHHHGAIWCYASSLIAAVSALALLAGKSLNDRQVAWLIYGYLGIQGFNLLALSARMLFEERHHPSS